MSGFDALWGDELTDIDVAECLEVETQASQAQGPSSVQPLSFGFRGTTIGDGSDSLVPVPATRNICRPPGSILSQIPRMLQIPPIRYDRGQSSASTLSTSSTTSSSSPSYPPLTQNQRKLKTPIRSLPDMSQTIRDKNQAATKEWLRKELEKHKKQETELEQNRQTLEGEVRLLRERNHSYQQQLIKVREQAEEEFKTKEEKYLNHIKELKKEAESAKIQLVMKSKESEANKERYLELKNVSVLEPEFPQASVRERSRRMPIVTTPRSSACVDKQLFSADDDNEDDYFSDQGLVKKARKDTQLDLKTYSCDELIRVMDTPRIISPTKRSREAPPMEIQLTESPFLPSDYTTPVKSLPSKEPSSKVVKIEVPECKASDMSMKFPWLKVKGYSLSFHLGRLLDKEVSDKIYMLSDPEIKIIVPPRIDFDPGNVLKMDCSDLQYLEDLEKGETIWGVDLKTMYDTSKPAIEEPSKSESKDTEALETVKTILGSQMCGQSPDRSKHNESSIEAHSPGEGPTISKTIYSVGNEDSMLLRNLEPIHVHLKALTKLASWDSSMDLISSIIQHITLMINELHERVCDPRIPDQLKDQFYNNEFGAGKLFMNGPYQSNDLLTHEKWNERERYVELRRGLAVLSVLCSLNKETANLVLDPQLLNDMAKNNNSIIPSQNNTTYNRDSFMATSLRNQTHRKIMSKAEETTIKFTDLLKKENSVFGKQMDQLTDRFSGSRLSSDTSTAGTSAGTSSSISSEQNQHLNTVRVDISHNEIENLLKSKVERCIARTDEEEENLSEASNPSTVNPDEIMDIEAEEVAEGDFTSSVPRSLDEIDHDSFKAWYETYTQNKLNFTVEEGQSSGTKSQKFSKLLDPQLAEKERRELSVYLKRRKFYKEFYKAVAEKGLIWIPDKSDEGGYTSDVESVKNLFDYENKISTMNSTITSDELASMKPGPFCPVNEDSAGDVEATKSQDESPVDNEWRVNSLQKNEEDPNFTKVEEPTKLKPDKNWSFFEKFKANNAETTNVSSNMDTNVDSRSKPSTSKSRKRSLAPLKKKAGRDVSPSGSLTDINKEMEMEVEMLFGKTTTGKKFDKFRGEHQAINEMAPFTPEFRFPEVSCDEDQRSDTLPEHFSTVPTMEDPEFLHTFKELYSQAEAISAKLNVKLKPFKKLVTCAYLEQRSSAEEEKNKSEARRPKKSLTCDRDAGSTSAGTSMRNQDESDAIISMLNDEALKYSLNKNIKSFEKKKGNLHLLDGIYEIVSAINYSRLTLVFYPLLSSCVSLMESLFKQSFNNEYFNKESFVLIMKILNEVTCCQPPPDIIEKILGVLLYAVKYPEVVDCLCKKRSNLVSLVTKTEFCFFKGVCMMQLLCYLVGILSGTLYPGYWTLCLAFTSWLRQLYERHRLYLEPWYPPNQVCNCVRVLHNSLFTTLAKATSFLANHASGRELDEGVRSTVESIVRDGIRLCEILIDMDTSFVNHLDRFHLYREFLTSVKEMHCDPHFSPLFHLQSHQLKVVECLINANELLASKSKSADQKQTEKLELEHTKANFNRVFDLNNIFLNCADKYDLLC